MTSLTRFAPTPSGYLHLGNAANAVLCAWLAADQDARLIVRLDDLDRDRWRADYEEDALALLAWLGVEVDAVVRQSELAGDGRYRQALEHISDLPQTFVCSCSRQSLASGQPCRCDEDSAALQPGSSSLRWRSAHGDVVLWRRDGIPAYHLASVVDDALLGVTHIVRGEDLREATVVQRELAPLLGATTFLSADIRLHGLLLDAQGAKLSKSQLDRGPLPRDAQTRQAILEAARSLASSAGIAPR